MIITYHGESFVKIQHGDLIVALNPIGKVGQVRVGGKDPFVITGPGEYEVSNVFIRGFETATLNTIYLLSLDGLRLAHCGASDETKIPEAAMSEIGEVDILFVSFGGPSPLSPAAAYKLALMFQPKIILPLSESEPSMRQFLKEAGAEKVKSVEKLVLKKKDVLEKEGEIIILSAV